MSEVSIHPVIEAVACRLFGIEGVPPGEAGRMVNRAVKVAAEMYDHLEEQRDIYADAAYRWWKQARVNNACVWAHIRNFERALREAEDLTRERDEWKRRAEAAEADNLRARDLIEAYGVPRQRAESVSRAIDVLVTRMDRERDDLRRENARYRDALLRIMPLARSVRLLTGADRDVLDMAVSVIRIVDEALTEAKTEIVSEEVEDE